jgi:hypothetical protein
MSVIQITPHFAAHEFDCKDGTPYPLDLVEKDGTPYRISRLLKLCETLEVIREAAGGRPLRVTSGFRSLEYNRRLGSSDNSQHVKGRAADIQHPILTAGALHTLILKLYNAHKLPWLGGLGHYITFVHVDVRPRPEDNHLAQWLGTRVQTG